MRPLVPADEERRRAQGGGGPPEVAPRRLRIEEQDAGARAPESKEGRQEAGPVRRYEAHGLVAHIFRTVRTQGVARGARQGIDPAHREPAMAGRDEERRGRSALGQLVKGRKDSVRRWSSHA